MNEDRSPDADFYKNIGPSDAKKKPRPSATNAPHWDDLVFKPDQIAKITSLNPFWSDILEQDADPETTETATSLLEAMSTSWWAKESALLAFVKADGVPQSLAGLASTIQKIDPTIGVKELVALTCAAHAYAMHTGQTAKIDDVVHGAGKGGLARGGWNSDQLLAIANGVLFSSAEVAFEDHGEVIMQRIIAVTPIQEVADGYFGRGMIMGDLAIRIDAEGIQALGLGPLPNSVGERFVKSLNAASKRARSTNNAGRAASTKSLSKSVDVRYSFLPQEEHFVCDGSDCGVKASVNETLARRRKALLDAFTQADLLVECGRVEGVPDESALEHQWYAVILAAASEQEDRGMPGPVLAAHAQDALSISGAKAKLLVRAARERGLLELPRDTIKRFSSPGSFGKPQDLPFPMEGFARLCADCYDTFSAP
jgi:hypothetical protein